MARKSSMETMVMAMRMLLCISLALISTVAIVEASDKIIRVKLHKGTTMKAGQFGQPLTTYYARVDIGSPPKTFNLSIDTSPGETWVPHLETIGRVTMGIGNRLHYKDGYRKKDSSSSVKDNASYKFVHKQCELEGKSYEDIFEFKDVIERANRVVIRQRFLAVSKASDDRLAKLPSDGVMALNPMHSSPNEVISILSNLKEATLIDQEVFSLSLDTKLDNTDGGEITFGGVNPAKLTGVLLEHRVPTNNFNWDLILKEVKLGETTVSCYDKNCVATLMTGLSDLVGPRKDVQEIIEALRTVNGGIRIEESSNDLYEIDCLNVAHLPPLKFVIDSTPYEIKASDYVRAKVGGIPFFESTTCYIAIFPHDLSKQWLLGTNFLANFYTVFDVEKRVVSIAPRT